MTEGYTLIDLPGIFTSMILRTLRDRGTYYKVRRYENGYNKETDLVEMSGNNGPFKNQWEVLKT